ncbi:nuclear transport factor 2 family protein [Mucilaginibacter sabulilitoris]|uniref:Nuclear transport factor 2 family protein n=1 Tax=Mucilaginibacter sabulilitoris TaxID=1173583 RepID=A0ABZ0TJD3_9SPHI|nr:nuclear transport factor 2 family protein [Mucilaginibacter sabulilitoris]WPU92926.1 nuclear transport factor 2 family protein [Mucilaginibacter sabulilitoris]
MKTSNQNNNLPTDEEKLYLATTFLTALRDNEWDTMRAIIAPDAVWKLPGTSILSGLAEGADAIIRRAQGLKHFGVKFQLKDILYGLHGVTLSLHNTATRDNLILDEQVAIVCEINDGKIISMATYLSDVASINAFFIDGI